ncbi:MAG: tRNA (adenosine(37)-N6)-dimethylallyltransferase MiaA [Acidimicrobiia bacterium]|nr:tRNA (adenosine(37)-N6)-dimethylallyltransferase MiaA [Acidimicrobiia bacterium]
MGPTASGKSEVALLVAERVGAEIVSVDSMQVYRGMDIGTAKPDASDRARVAHHMIDLVDPAAAYTVAEFQQAGRAVLSDLEQRGVPVLVVGGSGLHFRALVDPLEFPASDPGVRQQVDAMAAGDAVDALSSADPGAREHVDLANPRRVARALEIFRVTGATPSERAARPEAIAVRGYQPRFPLVAAITDPGDLLPGRVEMRFDAMLQRGLLEEVRGLGPRLGKTASQAVGYKQLLPVVDGRCTIEEGRRRAVDATRALAGRQRTYFGKDPRLTRLEWQDEPGQRADRLLAILEEAGWTS